MPKVTLKSVSRSFSAGAVASAALAVTMPASAQSSSGTIDVSLQITNACVVNDAAMLQADFGSAGSIAFDPQPGTFDTVDSELVGSMGALSVRCSPGASPTLTVGSGVNDDSGLRRMASGSDMIPYRLFTNAARDDEIIIGRQLSLGAATNAPIIVPIYARASNPTSIAQAGSYSDTVQVTLSW